MERIKRRDVKRIPSKTSFGDITLNDFANADLAGKSRVKKVTYGKYDVSDELVDSDTDNEFSGKKVRQRRKTNSESTGGNCVYPIEIWFLISDYIDPETVGKFSVICRDSYNVVNTAAFWFNLYKRHYRKNEMMPFRLRPESLKCSYALKQRVIRALHYMYAPFVSKCLQEEHKMTNPLYNAIVVKRKCVLMWFDHELSTEIIYNFKLQRMDVVTESKPPSFMQLLDDISVNQESGCLILEVVTNKFVGTPPVLGLTLISVNYNITSLELIFSSSVIPNSTYLTTVTFDTVKKLNVYHWWSPHYPHSNAPLYPYHSANLI